LLPGASLRVSDRVLLSSPLLSLAAARRPGAKPRGGGAGRRSAWLAADGSKRWGEAFFLLYTPFWLTLCLGVVVPFKLYEVLLCPSHHLVFNSSRASRMILGWLVVGRSTGRVLDWILDDVATATTPRDRSR
jgi:hypothetical protein